MSFFKKLFGGGAPKQTGPKELKELEYKDFTVIALEMREGGEYQLCGEVTKIVGGELKVHKFVRADRLASADQAADAAIAKGCQIIDEQGERLFG